MFKTWCHLSSFWVKSNGILFFIPDVYWPLLAHIIHIDCMYVYADQTPWIRSCVCYLWTSLSYTYCLFEVWHLPNISLCASSWQDREAQSIFHLVQRDSGRTYNITACFVIIANSAHKFTIFLKIDQSRGEQNCSILRVCPSIESRRWMMMILLIGGWSFITSNWAKAINL